MKLIQYRDGHDLLYVITFSLKNLQVSILQQSGSSAPSGLGLQNQSQLSSLLELSIKLKQEMILVFPRLFFCSQYQERCWNLTLHGLWSVAIQECQLACGRCQVVSIRVLENHNSSFFIGRGHDISRKGNLKIKINEVLFYSWDQKPRYPVKSVLVDSDRVVFIL